MVEIFGSVLPDVGARAKMGSGESVRGDRSAAALAPENKKIEF